MSGASAAQAFLALETPLATHMERMESYLPVAESISGSEAALQKCLTEHPVDKAMRDLDFDTAETQKVLKDADEGEKANDLVRDLLDLTGAIVERRDSIRAFSTRLEVLESDSTAEQPSDGESETETDLCKWETLDILATATLSLVRDITQAQKTSSALLAELSGIEEVTQEDIDEAELENHLTTTRLKSRRLSDEKRQSLQAELNAAQEKISEMQAGLKDRQRLSGELRPFLFIPKVADALSEPLRERVLDSSRDQDPSDWGQGWLVTAKGLVQGSKVVASPTLRWADLSSGLGVKFDLCTANGSCTTVSADGLTATSTNSSDRGDCNVPMLCGTPSFSTGEHEWSVRVTKLGGNAMALGVCCDTVGAKPQYGILRPYVSGVQQGGYNLTKQVTHTWADNDLVHFHLDMGAKTLVISVNGANLVTLSGLQDCVRPWFSPYKAGTVLHLE
ncbi:hypothetical protein KIPB_007732 [Kipferlia bialata]|uniref:Uncharacterized protein n=1 Tax=Kipferlia bialata TaxID=797122 RepID=A0A9K3D276_9EUKA|nr:hypothetical protein KIPB_007732 [Kipferlia bialata]|eukprot:g7732.t1